jgi:hypothetical protein
MPECGWMPKSGPMRADFGMIQNTKGLISSPISEGLTRRATGPCRRPWWRARPTRTPAHRCFGCILDVEAKGGAVNDCCRRVHLHLPQNVLGTKIRGGRVSEKPIYLDAIYRQGRWV